MVEALWVAEVGSARDAAARRHQQVATDEDQLLPAVVDVLVSVGEARGKRGDSQETARATVPLTFRDVRLSE